MVRARFATSADAPLFIAGVAGLAGLVWRNWRTGVLVLAFPLTYFVLLSNNEVIVVFAFKSFLYLQKTNGEVNNVLSLGSANLNLINLNSIFSMSFVW